jgi:hypothetical protein
MEGRKIRAIVKRTDEEVGHMTWISNTLPNLQKHVGGHIETVTLPGGVVVICDEEGRLKGKPHNCTVFPGAYSAVEFVGDIVVCGVDGDDFADIAMPMATWKRVYLCMEDNK